MKRASGPCADNNKDSNIPVIEVLEGEKTEGGTEKVLEEIMIKNF